MDREVGLELSNEENLIQPLLIASKSPTIEKALEQLIDIAKTAEGRLDLASQNIVSKLLQLCSSIPYPAGCYILLPALKLLRNLCAGEIRNQNAFLEQNGAEVVSTIIRSVGFASDYNGEIVRMGLQLLANFVLAGGEHQRAVWCQFFPHGFLNIARVRSRESCDPLCMVIYTCCEGDDGLLADLCNEQGLAVVIEIIQTASIVDPIEKWFKLLISRICIEESYTASVFFKLGRDCGVESGHFVAEQAYILSILSEMLNERIEGIIVNPDFALCVLGILRSAGGVVDFSTRGITGLPTGNADIDVLGYSLTILRDICACDHLTGGSDDVVGMLVSSGLIESLLAFLSNLEPPATIQKAMDRGETTSSPIARCPYKGFRRDIVAVIGNCAYRRKQVQDEIRKKNGIILLLQQCVTDEDNPFLREWGIWAARNLLEGNTENQKLVADLELQRSVVDVPELARLGLRVDIDPTTHRAKLVNIPHSE